MMEVALPMAATANMDCYEDMFKEITRKLYGEEGLPDGNGESGGGGSGSNAGGGGAAGGEGGGGLASSMRAAAAAAAAAGLSAGVGVMPDYDGEGNGGSGFKPEEGHHHHAHHGGALTAFGLAALMQNGFPPPPGMLSAHHHFQRGGGGGGGGVGVLNHHPHHHHPMPAPHNPTTAEDKWIPSEEALQWTSSKIASYNPAQKLFRCAECECVGFLSRVAEHWLGTHANLRVFQCPQCPYSSAWARCVRMHLTRQHNVNEPPVDGGSALYKENPVLEEVTKYLQRLKTKVETSGPSNNHSANSSSPPTGNTVPKQEYQHPPQQQQQQHHHHQQQQQQQGGRPTASSENNSNTKRYCCTFCPYATDRRDLFTRHENIHREEKPFQCYVCQKQFNRADHVKKHFLRMHRDYPYDLNRIRRQPPKNASGMSYYHKYNNNNPAQGTNNNNTQPGIMAPQIHQVHHHNLNIPSGFSTMGLRTNPPPPPIVPPPPPPPASIIKPKLQIPPPPPPQQFNGCNAKSHGSKTKKKGEKRYSCCYCAWSGVDNWCLKRHLNTHLKPFVCILCDYKAARSERLATHVLKVHNKRACGRCSFLADDQAQLSAHLQEHHPLEHRNNRSSNNVLRNVGFTSHPPPMSSSFGSQGNTSNGHHHNINTQPHHPQPQPEQQQHQQQHMVKEAMLQTNRLGLPPASHQQEYHHNDQYMRPSKQHYGAARLFHYMEASDNSDLEDDYDDSLAGQRGVKNEEEVDARMADEEEEPPPFLCRECGCEFVDDTSLETHNEYAHNPIKSPSSGGKSLPYHCSVCGHSSASQMAMMEHIRSHVAGLVVHCRAESCDFSTALGGDALQEHVTILHRDEGVPRCPHCGLGFDTGDVAERHGGEHHETQCSMCRAIFRKHFVVNSNQVMLTMIKNNAFINGRYGSNSVPDSNMNHSALLQRVEGSNRDDRRVTAEAATKRSRKQSQPRRVIPDGLGGVEAEIRVLRHTRYIDGQQLKRRRRKRHSNQYGSSVTAMVQLRDKYTELLLLRRGRRCNWCHGKQQDMFPYHTPVSLALHRLWRHVRLKFQCEHCNHGYRHRYQVILHGSREHISDKQHSPPSEPITVPKELTASENSPIESTFSSINVPDLLTNSTTPPVNSSSSPKDLRLDDSTMLNTPLPAPLPPTSSPPS